MGDLNLGEWAKEEARKGNPVVTGLGKPVTPGDGGPKEPAWYSQPWVKRFVAGVVGFGLSASCALWPPAAQPVCRAVGSFIHGFNFSGAP